MNKRAERAGPGGQLQLGGCQLMLRSFPVMEKISMIGGLDTFLRPLGECVEVVPPVEAYDLVSYLVLQTSFVTAKLESYNLFSNFAPFRQFPLAGSRAAEP